MISAYACEPNTGSEPGVGWHWSRQAALHGHDVHVITRANNRPVIETSLKEAPGVTFHYVDLPQPLRTLKARTGTVGLVAYYYLWQLVLAFKAYVLNRRHRFHLLHHVTFANDWLPSGLALVPGPPLVWGPVGGSTHNAPAHIEAKWPDQDRRYERLRRLFQRFFIRFDPLLALTRRRATVVLPYTEEARLGLPVRTQAKSRVVTHIGVDRVTPAPRSTERGQLEVITGGRLVHWKGFDLLIEGMADHLRRHPGTAVLKLTGSGPWTTRLAAIARREGISNSVEFVGRLSGQSAVLDMVAEADLYALPTWRDGPPVAILEAMSLATPILTLDLGATAELVPKDAGILIAVADRTTMVAEIGEALTWCYRHPSELRAMGRAAASRVADRHIWDSIGSIVDEIYRDTTDGK